MAKAQGVSNATVRRIWHQHQLKPHLPKSFKVSRDIQFVDKLHDIVGLYLNPPDHPFVLSVDEKSQIQALDRTQPGLPMKNGRCGTMTHVYKRKGTTTLVNALNMLTGKVIGDCMPRHRHQEFIRFLKKIDAETPQHLALHLIVDNCTSTRQPVAATPPAVSFAFHAHIQFLADRGGAVDSRAAGQTHPPRIVPKRSSIDTRH